MAYWVFVVFYLSFVNQFAIISRKDKYIKGDDARPSAYSVGHEVKRPNNVEQKSLLQWFNAVNYLSSQLKFKKLNKCIDFPPVPIKKVDGWTDKLRIQVVKKFMRIAGKVWENEVSYARECFHTITSSRFYWEEITTRSNRTKFRLVFPGLSEKVTQLHIRAKTPTSGCKKKVSAITSLILWCFNKTSSQDVWDW